MKIQKNIYRKIDLSLINKTENIRQDYGDISELAGSIESIGQLEAIGVIEKNDGTFDPVYGFRRIAAFQFLVAAGKDYNQIESKIIAGDPLIIQMTENESRKQLTPEEFENGLAKMVDTGMTQTEIAKLLSIRITRISDALAARKTRLKLDEKGIDTAGMSTSAVSALRNVPEAEVQEIVKKAKKEGGTVKAVEKAKVKKMIEKNPNMFVAHEPEVIEEKQELLTTETFTEKIIEAVVENLDIPIDELKKAFPVEIHKSDIPELMKERGNINFISSNLNENNKKIEVTYEIVDEIDNFAFTPVILESPYQSEDLEILFRNKDYLLDCCKDCVNKKESPYASHKIFPDFLDEITDRKLGIAAGQAWYAHAAYMVVYDDYGITPGMQTGIDFFKSIKPNAEIEYRKLYKENENGK